MISKVISSFKFFAFPLEGKEAKLLLRETPGKERRRKILENSRTQNIMGEIYGLHSDRKGRKSKGSHKRTMVPYFFHSLQNLGNEQ